MNPIIISIAGFEIRWYSVLILLAVIVVLKLTQIEAKRFNIPKEFIFNLLFWCLIFGIIGARLYYVLFNYNLFKDDPLEILKIWHGGLAIHGGLIAGLITLSLYTKKYKVRAIRILDLIVVPLLLGQAIGRWGNFFNQEAHGVATSIEHLKVLFVPDFIIKGMTIDGVIYTPTFFYESVVCLIAFIVLLIIRKGKYVKTGTMTALYLLIYGVLRFFIEISRTDALMFMGFKVAQVVSVIMIIIGTCMLMIISKKGKFEDLYNDTANIDVIKF